MQLKIEIHFEKPWIPDISLHSLFYDIASLQIEPTIKIHKKSKINANKVATKIFINKLINREKLIVTIVMVILFSFSTQR